MTLFFSFGREKERGREGGGGGGGVSGGGARFVKLILVGTN